jgi:hypothetical protein
MRRMVVLGQPTLKVKITPSQQTSLTWWLIAIMLAPQEAEIGRRQFKANPGKKYETLAEKYLEQRG